MTTNIWELRARLIPFAITHIKRKNVEQVLSLVTLYEGSSIARIVETSNVQPHAVHMYRCLYHTILSSDANKKIQYRQCTIHPLGRSVALFLTILVNLLDSHTVKTKASVTPSIIYVPTHIRSTHLVTVARREVSGRKVTNIYQNWQRKLREKFNIQRPLQNLHPLNFHLYTLIRMNIFDQKMPLEVTF